MPDWTTAYIRHRMEGEGNTTQNQSEEGSEEESEHQELKRRRKNAGGAPCEIVGEGRIVRATSPDLLISYHGDDILKEKGNTTQSEEEEGNTLQSEEV